MVNDSDEMQNIFEDPQHAEIRAELMDYIQQRPDDAGPIHPQVGME